MTDPTHAVTEVPRYELAAVRRTLTATDDPQPAHRRNEAHRAP
jgi:hypothetical protein